MYGRIGILSGLLFVIVLNGNAQPNPKDAIKGLERYAAAIDAVESATFYYKREFFHPALNQEKAAELAIRQLNRSLPSGGGMGLDKKQYENVLNQQIERMMQEDRQIYIHLVSVGKNYLRNAQYLPDGHAIQDLRLDGDTLTSLNRFRPDRKDDEMTKDVRKVWPSMRWLGLDFLEWRKALAIVPDATTTVEALENGNFLMKIEPAPQAENGQLERYELKTKPFGDAYVPCEYRSLGKTSTRTVLYDQYEKRNGLLLPAFMKHETVYSQEQSYPMRPGYMTYQLLPETYKPGGEID